MADRIYVIKSTDTPAMVRLVRAPNGPQALRHVVDSYFTVELASQDDCIAYATAGAKVENAKASEP